MGKKVPIEKSFFVRGRGGSLKRLHRPNRLRVPLRGLKGAVTSMSSCTLIQVTLNVGLMKPRKGFTPVAGTEEEAVLIEGVNGRLERDDRKIPLSDSKRRWSYEQETSAAEPPETTRSAGSTADSPRKTAQASATPKTAPATEAAPQATQATKWEEGRKMTEGNPASCRDF